jgi:hypothetical protein
MALKSYHKETLIGGWLEDRAPKLRGVIADYGHREYSCTASSTFIDPATIGHHQEKSSSTGRLLAASKQTAPFSMANSATFTQSMRHRPCPGKPETGGFGAILPSHNASEEERHFETSATAAGRGTGTMIEAASAPAGGEQPWVVGRAGARAERGMSTSGVLGEVLKVGSDPQNNTSVQRSWMYQEDPMLKYRRGNGGAAAYAEAAAGREPKARYNPHGAYKREKCITQHFDTVGLPKKGRNLYMDAQ